MVVHTSVSGQVFFIVILHVHRPETLNQPHISKEGTCFVTVNLKEITQTFKLNGKEGNEMKKGGKGENRVHLYCRRIGENIHSS